MLNGDVYRYTPILPHGVAGAMATQQPGNRRVYEIACNWRQAMAEWKRAQKTLAPTTRAEINDLRQFGGEPMEDGQHVERGVMRIVLPVGSHPDLREVRDWLASEGMQGRVQMALRFTVEERRYVFVKWFDAVCFDFALADYSIALIFKIKHLGASERRDYIDP